MPHTVIQTIPTELYGALPAILDTGADSVCFLNSFGEIRFINPYGEQLCTEHGLNDVIGSNWVSLWPESVQRDADSAILASLMGRRYRFCGHTFDRCCRKRYWDVTVRPVQNEQGTLEHILISARDVTHLMEPAGGRSSVESLPW